MTKAEMVLYRRRREKIRRMARKGISQAEIARKLGFRNRQRVHQILNGQ